MTLNGKVSPIEHYHVFYQGRNVESENFTHPDINRIENYLQWRDIEAIDSGKGHLPGFTYEKPDVHVDNFRKKKSAKPKAKSKPKRKVVKKKSCGCK